MSFDLQGKKILIVLFGAIGDVIRALPLAARIKNSYPSVELHWAIEPKSVGILEGNRWVDRVVLFERGRGLSGARDFLFDVRSQKYDIVLDLQRIFKSGLTSFFSRAPLRLGFGKRNCKELNWIFNNRYIDDHENFSWKFGHYQLFGDLLGLPTFHIDEFHFKSLAPEPLASKYLGPESLGARHLSHRHLSPMRSKCQTPSAGTVSSSDISTTISAVNIGARHPAIQTPIASSYRKGLSIDFGIVISKEHYENADNLLGGLKSFVTLIIGSSWKSRYWPEEKYVELILKLYRIYGIRSVLVGGPGDIDIANRIIEAVEKSSHKDKCLAPKDLEPKNLASKNFEQGNTLQEDFKGNKYIPIALNLLGKTKLLDLGAVLERSLITIGPDTGPSHLAAALGVPVITLWGSTSPKRSYPYGFADLIVETKLECRSCYKRSCPGLNTLCMQTISADDVLEKVDLIINSTSR